MRRVTHERYISQSQRANCDLARRYVGLNLSQQVVCLLIVSPDACSLHGSPHQDAQVPQRWPMAERWEKLWRFSTLTLKIGASLVVRESRHRLDIISDKNSRKTKRRRRRFCVWDFFFKSGRAHPVFSGEFSFLWPRKREELTFLGGGYRNLTSKPG